MAQNTLDLIIRSRKEGNAAQSAKSELGGLKSGVEDLTGVNLGAAAALGALTAALKFSISAAAEAQVVDAQLTAVIKSTGGAAGLTADELDRMAVGFADLTGIEDEAIKKGEAVLLTFTKVGKDVFPQATMAALNMSAALGQDLQSSIVQIGKALNDPIQGVTALRRVGVSFTESQQAMIKSLVDSGKELEAQKFILAELETEFGGAAEAMGGTFTGSVNELKNAVGDLGEEIGSGLLPPLQKAVEGLTTLLTWNRKVEDAINDHSDSVAGAAATYEDYITELERSVTVAGYWIDRSWGQIKVFKGINDETDKFNVLTREEFDAVQAAAAALQVESSAAEKLRGNHLGLIEARMRNVELTRESTDAAKKAAEAADREKTVYELAIDALRDSNLGLATRLDLEEKLLLASGKLTDEDVLLKDAIGFLTQQVALGNLSWDEYLQAMDDLASGAVTAEDLIKRVGAAINALPTSKNITIDVRYRVKGGGAVVSEPGGDAPVIIPGEPGWGSGGGGGGPQARGGTYSVNAPTWFMAGEAGPETVSFSPMNGGGGRGGGGGVFIGELHVNAAPGMNEGMLSRQVIADLAEAARAAAMSGSDFAG